MNFQTVIPNLKDDLDPQAITDLKSNLKDLEGNR